MRLCRLSLRLHDRQCTRPVGPSLTQSDPEETVGHDETWAAPAVNDGGELLPQGEIVEYEVPSRECQGANGPEGQPEKQKHFGRMRTHVRDGKGRDRGGWGFGEAPHIGQHTDVVLQRPLGMTAAEIEALRRDGAI